MTIGSKNYREKFMQCYRAKTNQRRIVTYLDVLQATVNALREPHKGVILQSAGGDELRLRTLLPSVLDRAFKGEL
jgi:hypothetical protein